MSRSGAVIYRGPSLLDGAPIVVIVTGLGRRRSSNMKTGPMVQVWILREDVSPLDAVKSGEDASICGSCPLRSNAGRARLCYVRVEHAPQGVWRAYHRGAYPDATPLEVAAIVNAMRPKTGIRLGAYGDPAAAPALLWEQLTTGVRRVTGYTHGVPIGSVPVMASIETLDDASTLQERGIRYFRVGGIGEVPAIGEVLCPASAESDFSTTCLDCGLCDGPRRTATRAAAGLPALPNVFIPVHGARSSHWGK